MRIEQIEAQVARAQSWRGSPLGEPGDMSLLERRQYHEALGRSVRPAGVLILLIEREAQLNVVLTQRTAHLYDHAGQISFPGGRQDDTDADIIATALRESAEEIGTDSKQIQIVGDAFEVPLDHLLDDKNWRRDSFLREGQRREYWAVPFNERYIWGATAGMLRTFREVLLHDLAAP